MKKYNLLKVLAITILACWLLTLVIPGSYVDYSGNITTDAVAGSGIWGLFSNVSISISYFNGIAVFLIAVACFYGILNKLDVYNRFTKKTALLFKDKERLLVIITIIVFGLISALISEFMLLLVFVPFIYNVMKRLEIDKKVFLSSTLIAALIGSICRVYDSNLFSLLSLEINTLLLVKAIVFVLAISALIFLIAPKGVKKEVSKNKKDNKKAEKKKDNAKVVKEGKKSDIVFYVLAIIFTLLVIASSLPFAGYFSKFTVFTDLNNTLADFKIAGYNVFSHIIGTPVVESTSGTSGVINALGSWTITDMSILLFIMTLVIGLFSKVKFNDFIASITESIKKILPVAITAMLISLVLVLSVTTGINITIVNAIVSITKGFNIATTAVATILGSILTGDSYYFISTLGQVFISNADKDYYGIIGFIMQSLYNLTMFVAPTSTGLVIGLYYLDIPFNKWFKYIWKVLLAIFVIIIITTIVLYVII